MGEERPPNNPPAPLFCTLLMDYQTKIWSVYITYWYWLTSTQVTRKTNETKETGETGERRERPGYNLRLKWEVFFGSLQIFIVYYEDTSSFAAGRGESQRLA